jgi:hypothetical protein
VEVTWIFGHSGVAEIEWVDKYIDSYDIIHKVENYYLGLTGDKNIVYDFLPNNEKYSDILQMFTKIHLELKVKYGFYNFLLEKLIIIS